ncbi:MAG: GTPase ObgE, partial [Elusimicrobiota bacterium]
EKYVPLGGPDGGNGGKGGDVYLLADPQLTTLLDFSYRPHFRAKDGMPGSNSNCYGRGAEDIVIKVPVGTVIHTGGKAVADLTVAGQKIMIAKGGRGGRGISSFKTQLRNAPHIAEKGELGEEVAIDLELKLIADVGLVGVPNAGKSTFLSRVSAARPKIADYPFTTLKPNLGVVAVNDMQFVIADIPGLIEGAHDGHGLGDEFLRHIQRTKVLVHLIDVSGFDGKTAYHNYKTINNELSRYSPKMLKKPMLIAVNKMDVTDAAEKLKVFKRYAKKKKIFPISAVTGEGMPALMNALAAMVAAAPPDDVFIEETRREYVYEPDFTVTKQEDVFVVSGKKIEKLWSMTDFNQQEALRRFQNILKKMGVEKSLDEHGAVVGDTVRICSREYVYEK